MRWCDLLRVKSEFPINLWPNAVQAYHRWIRTCVKENMPYDRFVREMLTASGSNFRKPQVNFYRAVQSREPQAIAHAVALSFMGVRPESWPQERWSGLASDRSNRSTAAQQLHQLRTGRRGGVARGRPAGHQCSNRHAVAEGQGGHPDLGGRTGSQTTIALAGWNLPVDKLIMDTRDKVAGNHPLSVHKGGAVSNTVRFDVDTLPECLEKASKELATRRAAGDASHDRQRPDRSSRRLGCVPRRGPHRRAEVVHRLSVAQ